MLEWVASPFSRGTSQARDRTQVSRIAGGFFFYQLNHKGSPRILEWVAYPFSSGSSPGLLHCRRILYQLSHPGSPIYILLYIK